VPNTVAADTLRQGAYAAILNARRLETEARVLLSHGTAPTAFSIAVLALEEAAKAVQWWRLVSDRKDVDVSVPSRSHIERLREVHRTWHLLDALVAVEEDPDAEAPNPADTERAINDAIRSDNVRKQRGFYVDVKGDEVLEPSRISRQDAEEIIRLAEIYISMVYELDLADIT
jgi:AbiV family abortive infection protein